MIDISDDEIIRLAALTLKVDQSDRKEDADELDRGLAQPHSLISSVMISFARKILEGLPFSVTSDDPQTIARSRSLAQALGASEETIEVEGPQEPAGEDDRAEERRLPQIIFRPPARQ